MKRLILTLVGLLLWAPLAAAETTSAIIEREATGEISIDADGSVHDLALDEGLEPQVASALERRIRGWKFEPIIHDGRAVDAKTRISIQLSGVPASGDRYALQIDSVSFGSPASSHVMQPPAYPPDLGRHGIGAKVVLVIRTDREGNASDLHVEQVSLTSDSGEKRKLARWRNLAASAAVTAARGWKFDLTEIVDGQPQVATVRVPVEFVMGSAKRWVQYVPGEKRPIPWRSDSDDLEQGLADLLRNGEMQPLDSRFKLLADVSGTVL